MWIQLWAARGNIRGKQSGCYSRRCCSLQRTVFGYDTCMHIDAKEKLSTTPKPSWILTHAWNTRERGKKNTNQLGRCGQKKERNKMQRKKKKRVSFCRGSSIVWLADAFYGSQIWIRTCGKVVDGRHVCYDGKSISELSEIVYVVYLCATTWHLLETLATYVYVWTGNGYLFKVLVQNKWIF